MRFAGLAFSGARMVSFGLALLITLLAFWFLKATKTGKAIRATSQSREVALVCGINVPLVYLITFGMAAALAAADLGAQVSLIEKEPSLGGHLRISEFGLQAADLGILSYIELTALESSFDLVEQLSNAVSAHPGITVRTSATVFGWYEGNYLGVSQGNRLIKLRTDQLVIATGRVEQPLVFQNNDLPGIFLGGGLQRLMNLYGIKPGLRAVVVTTNDQGWYVARDLLKHDVEVAMLVDARPEIAENTITKQVREDGVPVKMAMTIKNALAGLEAGGGKVVVIDHPGMNRPAAFVRLGEFIAELNGLPQALAAADLIVTYGAPASLAAKKESRDVPVLFADVYDPVALGIVKDLVVPGGEITGVSGKTPLETLIKAYGEIQPAKKMGVLFSSDDRGSVLQVEQLETLARNQGFKILKQDVKRPDGVPEALSALAGQVDCLFAAESAVLNLRLDDILNFSAQNKLPLLSQTPGLSDKGALITLEADPAEQGQLVAVYALQILAGKKAHTLPVFTPKKVSLVINLKAAEKLNLKVPFQALSMATRVIK